MKSIIEILLPKKFRKVLESVPIVFIRDGKIIQSNWQKEKVSYETIEKALRSKGLRDINEVELGILETDGEISILPMKNKNWKVVQHHKKTA